MTWYIYIYIVMNLSFIKGTSFVKDEFASGISYYEVHCVK